MQMASTSMPTQAILLEAIRKLSILSKGKAKTRSMGQLGLAHQEF
jgi:hypothetical protein